MNQQHDSLTKQQVKMPREFFVKARGEYNNWRWAFFRELIQNAYDARSRHLAFHIWPGSNNTVLVKLVDDGHGMTRDVLVNTLLCLGGSLKKDAGSVGGFGYAKTLLFFANRGYEIVTGFNKVKGSGGEYVIEDMATESPGTTITVSMENESVDAMKRELTRYVSYLRTPRQLSITLDDQPVPCLFDDFEYKAPTRLGSMLFKDIKAPSSEIIVSVGGLPMFLHSVYTAGDDAFAGVLSLEGNTFDLLTANRDALKGDYAHLLTILVRRMIEERFAFKMGRTVDVTINFTHPRSNLLANESRLALENSSDMRALEDPNSIRFMNNAIFPLNFNLRIQNTISRRGAEHGDEANSVAEVMGSLSKQWVQRLALSWKIVVHQLLKTRYMQERGVTMVAPPDAEEFYLNGKRIATGFIYAKDIEGLTIVPAEGAEILILCNPKDFDKSFIVGDLLDLAIHECTHLQEKGHNDLFVDYDMKLRRSLRRLINEVELAEHVKFVVKKWRSGDLVNF